MFLSRNIRQSRAMCVPVKSHLSVIILFIAIGGVLPRHEREHRKADTPSFLGGFDSDWMHPQRHGDFIPEYDYTKLFTTRQLSSILQDPGDTRQRGGPSTRVTPIKKVSHKLYNGRITATVLDGPRKKSFPSHQLRHGGSAHEQYSQDQPYPTPHPRHHPCVRCPGDRAVLAPKGSTFVIMDTPPITPCNLWSSVEKVKSEVLVGPQPGTKMAEGSHKLMLRLYQHKRTLATCVIRYNVIVRKCPELELSPGVKADCKLGNAWGSHCNLTCGPGYLLEGDSITECTDELEWSGVQPQCIMSTACLAPVSPDNGHLSCRTPQHRPVSLQEASILPDGTICRFRCLPGYEVPPEQSHLVRMRCVAGSWDNDQDPVCVETNDLEEEEEDLPTEITVNDALRFDGKDCPEGFCFNGGKCLTILNEPMCSCLPGYSGQQCEEEDSDMDSNTENVDNTIT